MIGACIRGLQGLWSVSVKYLRVYRVLVERKAESFLFFFLMIIVGALGLWAPPLLAWVNAADPAEQFIKALEVGHG